MSIISLCNKVCKEKIPFSPIELLGKGSDGEVYSIREQNKVIKYCAIYDWFQLDDFKNKSYSQINGILSYIENHNPHGYARVYEHGFLFSDVRRLEYEYQEYIIYFYVLEKLYKISYDETRVFNTILSHLDMNRVSRYTDIELNNILFNLNKGLEFDIDEVLFFNNAINKCAIKHNDIHSRNIMKDSVGKFKLVDFDRSTL
jgi:thiamine kinase-like enzyme